MNSQDFFNLFTLQEGTDYINKPYIWDESSPDIGFAILRKYPTKKKFIPAKNNLGEDDSVMIIKAFILRNKLDEESVGVGTTVANVSLYKLDKPIFFDDQYDYSDPHCPTKESTQISETSTQPINLEEMSRFTFNTITNTFWDNEDKKTIQGKEIIEYIYGLHLETISNSFRNYWLRLRIRVFRNTLDLIKWSGEILIKVIPIISGKEIKNDSGNLFYEPFKWANTKGVRDVASDELVDYQELLKKVSPLVFSAVTALILLMYFSEFYYGKDFLRVISFLRGNKGDQIFSVTVITFVVLFFNYLLPNGLLLLLNWLILTYRKLAFKKIDI